MQYRVENTVMYLYLNCNYLNTLIIKCLLSKINHFQFFNALSCLLPPKFCKFSFTAQFQYSPQSLLILWLKGWLSLLLHYPYVACTSILTRKEHVIASSGVLRHECTFKIIIGYYSFLAFTVSVWKHALLILLVTLFPRVNTFPHDKYTKYRYIWVWLDLHELLKTSTENTTSAHLSVKFVLDNLF